MVKKKEKDENDVELISDISEPAQSELYSEPKHIGRKIAIKTVRIAGPKLSLKILLWLVPILLALGLVLLVGSMLAVLLIPIAAAMWIIFKIKSMVKKC